MQIFGVSAMNGTQAVSGVKGIDAAGQAKAAAQVADVRDTVALSVEGIQAASAGDIRFDRVQAIRAAIADGSYETPEKLDIALDRLLDSLG